MKIPQHQDFTDSRHSYLWDRDQREFYNSAPKDFSARFYKIRFDFVITEVLKLQKSLGKPAKDIRVLDVGCAQGNFSLALAERGFDVFAVDLQASFLSFAKLKYESGKIRWINASLGNLPFGPECFDIILATEVIEHVAYPHQLLAELKRVSQPQGMILLTTPNGSRLFTGMPTYRQIKDPKNLEPLQFLPDSDGHLFLLTREELKSECERAGLKIIHQDFLGSPWMTGGMKFDRGVYLIPLSMRRVLDQLFLKIPLLAKHLAEGQMMIFQPRGSAVSCKR